MKLSSTPLLFFDGVCILRRIAAIIAFMYFACDLTAGQQCQDNFDVPNQEGIEEFAFGPYLDSCTGLTKAYRSKKSCVETPVQCATNTGDSE